MSCPIIHTDHVDMLSDEISPPPWPGSQVELSPLPPHYTRVSRKSLAKAEFSQNCKFVEPVLPSRYSLIRITANLFEIKREMKQIVRLAAVTNVFILGGPDLAQYAGKKHINRGRWTKEEDEKLKRLVEVHGERWDLLASHFPDRADVQCQHRWQKVVNPELVKGRIIVQFYRLLSN